MKKNGVAPSAYTYRAILEGMYLSQLDASTHQSIIKDVHSIFEEMEAAWTDAITARFDRRKKSGEEEVIDQAETSTARSYRLTKGARDAQMMNDPTAFIAACHFYLAILLHLGMHEEAVALLRRSPSMVSVKRIGKNNSPSPLVGPQLPYVLTYRYLVQLSHLSSDEIATDNLVLAWQMLIKLLQDSRIIDQLSRSDKWIGIDRELDRSLLTAQIALEKVRK